MNSLLEAERPAVFFINGIGDNFINLPALRALAKLFQGRMSLICAKRSSACILEELEVRRRIPVAFRINELGKEFQVDDVVEAVGSCDFFLSLVPWLSPSLQLLRSRLQPRRTLGFFKSYDIALELDFAKHSAELALTPYAAWTPSARSAILRRRRPTRIPPSPKRNACWNRWTPTCAHWLSMPTPKPRKCGMRIASERS